MTVADIPYHHRVNSRAKRLTLKLNQVGEVVVVSPRFTPAWVIRQFVESQAGWIQNQVTKLQRSKSKLLGDQKDVLLFGKSYQVVIKFETVRPPGIYVLADQLIINPYQPDDTTLAANRRHIHRYLKKSARTYIEQRVLHLADLMQVRYVKLQLREQSSRWGSCSHTGTLSLNWRLAHCPPAIIDYVLVHELAHLVHFDHSQSFWKLVARHDTEYREHRQWLKAHGSTILAGV